MSVDISSLVLSSVFTSLLNIPSAELINDRDSGEVLCLVLSVLPCVELGAVE